MNLYEQRQKEMMEADDETYARCDVLHELQRTGNNIPALATITTQKIRFNAWLCRAALNMILQESIPAEGTAEWELLHPIGLIKCTKCSGLAMAPLPSQYKFCPFCGRTITGLTMTNELFEEENSDENNI